MTDILNSFWGRRKNKPAAPERPASERVVDGFVVVNDSAANRPHTSMYPTAQSNNGYEDSFSYMRVTETQVSTNGSSQPVRPAPPVPSPSAANLPYPIHRASNESYRSSTVVTSSTTSYTVEEQSSSTHYLTGIPFQLAKGLSSATILNQLNNDLYIKSPNLTEYEYSFNIEMQVIQESSPTARSPIT